MDNNPNYHPPTSSPPSGQFDASQFDFIMNSGQKQKRGLLPTGSPKQRLIMFVVIGLGVLLLLVGMLALVFGSGDERTEKVVGIASQQSEIIRVAEIGNKKAGGLDAKKLAAITTSTITSDQKQTINYLTNVKRKVNAKELSQSRNSETDETLAAAERNGRFDEVFKQELLEMLEKYRNNMQGVYPELGKNGKELFDTNHRNVTLILSDNKVVTE